jgi:hypothetical protein
VVVLWNPLGETKNSGQALVERLAEDGMKLGGSGFARVIQVDLT